MSNMRLEFLKAAWRDLDSITVYISLSDRQWGNGLPEAASITHCHAKRRSGSIRSFFALSMFAKPPGAAVVEDGHTRLQDRQFCIAVLFLQIPL